MSALEFRLEGRILDHLVDEFTMSDRDFAVEGKTFRQAYLEETEGIGEDAIVLIDPATGHLYEVEFDVSVRRVEPPKDELVVDPNQLALPGGA